MSGVKFISFDSRATGMLEPAPSIMEEAAIYKALREDTTPRLEAEPETLLNKTVKIIADYRGGLLYTEGGLKIHRYAPSSGFNQYAGAPIIGTTENVKVGGWFAKIEFV
jgi:hypothetical protein